MNRRTLAVALAAVPSLLWAQGPLTPPGAPAPTMKTLAQVEPRTPISSLPFTITNGGSYYLAASLTGASGQSGITIQADNVTVDLEGFGLIGVPSSLHGVTVASGKQNIVVYNGILRGWGGNGLDAGGALNCRVTQLLAANNGGHGVSVGANGLVQDCLALSNTGDGVRVSSSCLVLNNSCHTNGVSGAGIHATGSGDRIEGNHLAGNLGSGIQVDGPAGLVVKNSVAYSGGTDYNIALGSSYGQLVQAPGASFTNATAWANFSSSCPPGFTFCSGVCVALTSDANNCGSCAHVCSLPNATAGCSGGNCVIASCNAGFADCDLNPANGCEVNVNSAVNNCGTCGHICSLPNATAGCTGGNCVIASCNTGFADCDANPSNGCEVNLNSSFNNCGTCGHVCNVPNATANCTGGACAIASCNAGFANCNNLYSDGCEVNISTDNNNCGGCGIACSPTTQQCASGSCKLKSGQACTTGSQCASGTCTTNVCS